ncbi:hypothetical protein DE146DRAFT_659193 [Phaeosphaeria sp. MPI-PUGE-AT-0046c]|nr:hypothetical protein DE146DRAFT_659193 [Phaeosphaeria sp. MPI-PUGE-AT-0046c]
MTCESDVRTSSSRLLVIAPLLSMKPTLGAITTICLYLAAIAPGIEASSVSTAQELDRNDPVYRAALEKECGPLGVMEVPVGVPERKVRHCREHPLSLKYPKLMNEHVHPSEWPIEIQGNS